MPLGGRCCWSQLSVSPSELACADCAGWKYVVGRGWAVLGEGGEPDVASTDPRDDAAHRGAPERSRSDIRPCRVLRPDTRSIAVGAGEGVDLQPVVALAAIDLSGDGVDHMSRGRTETRIRSTPSPPSANVSMVSKPETADALTAIEEHPLSALEQVSIRRFEVWKTCGVINRDRVTIRRCSTPALSVHFDQAHRSVGSSFMAASSGGKCPPGANRAPELRIQGLYGVGGVEDAADIIREGIKRDDLAPGRRQLWPMAG